MGCDIHPHIEVKIKGKWEHYSIPNLQRCYALFHRICGVRSGHYANGEAVTPIDKPRGLPADLSEVTKEEWNWNGGHSATWLNKDELNALIKWHEDFIEGHSPGHGYEAQHKEWGYMTGNNFLEFKDSNPEAYEDVRFICWFDN